MNKTLKRVILVYAVLIPVMWLLTETVWGGLHGALGGLSMVKVLLNPQTQEEIMSFAKQHGLSKQASREETKEWFKKLNKEDREEFQKIVMKSVNVKNIAGFGSTFAVCVIVFGGVGLLSGALTRTWLYVGILPFISFFLNNPILRFGVIRDMPVSQKAIIVLVSQFGASYIFAYIGSTISDKVARKRQTKMETKP